MNPAFEPAGSLLLAMIDLIFHARLFAKSAAPRRVDAITRGRLRPASSELARDNCEAAGAAATTIGSATAVFLASTADQLTSELQLDHELHVAGTAIAEIRVR